MAVKQSVFIDNNPPACDALFLNSVRSEINNTITQSGQSLDVSDTFQLSKAISQNLAIGTWYTDSGVADAYVLSITGSLQAPINYQDGMLVRFRPGNTNTGSSTVNVATLGVKTIKKEDGTTDPSGGDLPQDRDILLAFDSGNDVFRIVVVAGAGGGGGGGTVTSVGSGVGLTGGPITGSGTLDVDLSTLVTENTIDGANDTISFYDNSAAAMRKTTVDNFATAIGSSGAYTELSSTDFSGVTQVDITANINSTYKLYLLTLSNFTGTAGGSIDVRVSSNGGSTYASSVNDYKWRFTSSETSGSDFIQNDATTATAVRVATALGSSASDHAWLNIYMSNPANAAKKTNFRWDGSTVSSSLGKAYNQGTGHREVAEVTNAIRVLFTAGTMSGTLTLIGIK